MYTVAGDCPSNEELAIRIQSGDKQAAEHLISQNEGYITELAYGYRAYCELENLKQEGVMALLESAKRFDPSYGTKLLTYATPAVEAAIQDYAAKNSLTLSVPSSRYSQLRKVAHICSGTEDVSAAMLIDTVCKELEVSSKVAKELLEEYRTLFYTRQPSDEAITVRYGGDPSRAYDRYMRKVLLHKLMKEVLNPRELNLVRYYMGIGQSDEQGMTFKDLAIRLNYNGPSGAEKAYKGALRKLKKNLHSGVYGQWLSIQKAIHEARVEAESGSGCYISPQTTPQTTWIDEKNLAERSFYEVASLARVHEIFSEALENEEEKQYSIRLFS